MALTPLAPRVALYTSWTAQMDEEWTRFLFEQFEFPFACPGSVLRMKFDVTHPVAYGMPAEAPGMFISSPAFRLTPSFGDGARRQSPRTRARTS